MTPPVPSSRSVFLLLALVALLPACATSERLRRPLLTVERLKIDKVRITGVGIEVGLHLRNPNPEDLRIARFEYELSINGNHVGTGYHAEPVVLAPYGEASVGSTLEIGFLSLPGAVKSALDANLVHAAVSGKFFVQDGSSLRKLSLETSADVPLGK